MERVIVMILRPGADQRGDAPAPVREVEFPAVRPLMEQVSHLIHDGKFKEAALAVDTDHAGTQTGSLGTWKR